MAMNIKSKIQRTLLATLMVFATAAIGLQPLVFSSGSTCTCAAMASVDTNADSGVSSCCLTSVEEEASCCSSKKAETNPCCCNPEASTCECGDCGCSESNESHPPAPAIPTNETNEVVTPTLICAAPFVGFPKASELKRAATPKTVADHATLTSQQTCVLLSRFTC